jgi:hypothetical protein
MSFQPSLLFAGKAEAYTRRENLKGTPERGSTWVGIGLNCKHEIRLKRPAKDEQSSLFVVFVSYKAKKFITLVPAECRFTQNSILKII